MAEDKNREVKKGRQDLKPVEKPKVPEVSGGQGPKKEGAGEKFPVVGIGASAGGLEAFELFFRNLPSGMNAAFVLIQHLGTEQPSILRDLLERFTNLPVHEATEGMRIEPGHVYVIPVRVYMALEEGVLKLTERSGSRHHIPMPIDFFFRSLASERGENAVAILLSGTGTDGTLGFRDINGAGGRYHGTGAFRCQIPGHAGKRHQLRPCRLCAAGRKDGRAA